MARPRKKKAIVKDGYVTFLNDNDGLSAKDYLLILSTSIFFVFVTIGLIMVLFHQEIDKMFLSLLEMIVPVLMTVVGGVMGVQAVESFANRKKDTESIEMEDEV